MAENKTLAGAILDEKSDFDRFYSDTLEPILKELEGRRVRELRWVIAFIIVIGVVGGYAFYAMPEKAKLFVVFFVLFLGAPIFLYGDFRVLGRYGVRNRYKQEVIGRIGKFVSSDMIYDGARGISRHTFRLGHMFPNFNVFRGEDYFSCRIGKTRVEFSELTVEKATHAGGHNYTETIFRGVYFIADCNKDFAGLTIVLPDHAEAELGWVGKKLQELNFTRPGELVSLEDPDFEQAFVVYSTDQVEARYLLSPAMMDQIMKLREQFSYGISLAFVNSRLHVAIPRRKNDFDPPRLASFVDRREVESYYNSIRHTLSIVERLNLNRRVWTKQ